MDFRLPGFSICGILQAKLLVWDAIAFSGVYNGITLIDNGMGLGVIRDFSESWNKQEFFVSFCF